MPIIYEVVDCFDMTFLIFSNIFLFMMMQYMLICKDCFEFPLERTWNSLLHIEIRSSKVEISSSFI